MTSGTLAYSFGLGKAIVSTPYWHARELLADGRGILVPFGDAAAIGEEIAAAAHRRRLAGRPCASAPMPVSRSMTWPRIAERYLAVFENARHGDRLKVIARPEHSAPARDSHALPAMQIGHFLSLCDDTGLLQHAVHSRAGSLAWLLRRRQCARAAAGLRSQQSWRTAPVRGVDSRFAAFIQHAWNPDTGRFRNFLGFDRRWLEDQGSEDSHGRTLWALGECARSDASPSRRRWAAALFAEALPTVRELSLAPGMGLHVARVWTPIAPSCRRICAPGAYAGLLADRLMAVLRSCRDAGLGNGSRTAGL